MRTFQTQTSLQKANDLLKVSATFVGGDESRSYNPNACVDHPNNEEAVDYPLSFGEQYQGSPEYNKITDNILYHTQSSFRPREMI